MVLVRNDKKRSYNGVGHNQITKIAEENLPQYIQAGFSRYTPKEEAAAPDAGNAKTTPPAANTTGEMSDEEKAARVAFLQKNGVKNADKYGIPRLTKESDKLGFDASVKEATVNPADLNKGDDVNATINSTDEDAADAAADTAGVQQ